MERDTESEFLVRSEIDFGSGAFGALMAQIESQSAASSDNDHVDRLLKILGSDFAAPIERKI